MKLVYSRPEQVNQTENLTLPPVPGPQSIEWLTAHPLVQELDARGLRVRIRYNHFIDRGVFPFIHEPEDIRITRVSFLEPQRGVLRRARLLAEVSEEYISTAETEEPLHTLRLIVLNPRLGGFKRALVCDRSFDERAQLMACFEEHMQKRSASARPRV